MAGTMPFNPNTGVVGPSYTNGKFAPYTPPAPTNLDPASPEWQAYQQAVRSSQDQSAAAAAARNATKHRWTNLAGKLATGAVLGLGTAGLAPALLGGLGGASAATGAGIGAAAGSGAAGAAGGGMTFGNLLQLGQLGAGVGSQIFGMRSAGKQNAQDAMARQRELDQQMAFARETEAQRKAEYAAQQAALEKQWAADQQFKQDQWKASEEERLYARNQNDYARRLLEEKEARKAQNRLRLADLIRLGR